MCLILYMSLICILSVWMNALPAMTIPVVGRADADEAVAHAWKSFEENHKRAPKPADADEAVAHAWTGFKESVGKEKRTSVSADADEAVAHAWVSFNE